MSTFKVRSMNSLQIFIWFEWMNLYFWILLAADFSHHNTKSKLVLWISGIFDFHSIWLADVRGISFSCKYKKILVGDYHLEAVKLITKLNRQNLSIRITCSVRDLQFHKHYYPAVQTDWVLKTVFFFFLLWIVGLRFK